MGLNSVLELRHRYLGLSQTLVKPSHLLVDHRLGQLFDFLDVDGGLNPRLSGAALKTGTKFAANSWRPECGAMDPCQRRKPPEAVAKGQRLQGSVAR